MIVITETAQDVDQYGISMFILCSLCFITKRVVFKGQNLHVLPLKGGKTLGKVHGKGLN